MSPEYLGSNMWELKENEYVAGVGGVIKGPEIVIIQEFKGLNALLVEGEKTKIQIEGTDFKAKVRKLETNALLKLHPYSQKWLL